MKQFYYVLFFSSIVSTIGAMECAEYTPLKGIAHSLADAFPLDKEVNKEEFRNILYAQSNVLHAARKIKESNYLDAVVFASFGVLHLDCFSFYSSGTTQRDKVVRKNKILLRSIKENIENFIYNE